MDHAKIEVFEPDSDEERYLFAVLGQAKCFLTDKVNHPGGVVPHAFVFGGDDSLTIMDLRHVFGSDQEQALAAKMIQKVAAERLANFWALVSDSFVTEFKAPLDEIEAAGFNIHQHQQWAAVTKARFGLYRTEALVLFLEARHGTKTLRQHYHRQRGEVVFDKLVVMDEGDPRGIFVNLLPPSAA